VISKLSASARPERLGLTIAGVVAVAAIAGGIISNNPRVVGLYHDEGIYLAAAESIAADGSYRLINLPGAPLATKYPPLYPLALAAVWRAAPVFPDNIRALKTVNAVILGVVTLLVYVMMSKMADVPVHYRLLVTALTAFSPGLFSFSDLALSEPLFVAFVLGVLVLATSDAPDGSVRRELLAGLLAGLAILTRTIGVAVLAGLAWHVAARAGWRRAAYASAPGIVLGACWFAWSRVSIPDVELLQYYLAYEPSMWPMLFREPSAAMRVMAVNGWHYLESLPLVCGWPGWPLVTLAVVLIVAALSDNRRTELALPARVGIVYFALLLGHPMALERYLTPFVPMAYVLLGRGAATIAKRRLFGPMGILCLVPFLIVNGSWTRRFFDVTHNNIHGQLGRALVAPWTGFEQTLDWISRKTPADATLASGNDPFYFLYTRRMGIRPWPHRPEQYAPAYHLAGTPPSTTEINAALSHFGVDYLVVDPLPREGEGLYARTVINGVLASAPDRWREVFRTPDGSHRVYKRVGPG
jgi:hypothetical protein